jgi:hypothetical protein
MIGWHPGDGIMVEPGVGEIASSAESVMAKVKIGEVSWEGMIRALEKVRERLFRAAAWSTRDGVLDSRLH